MAVLPSAVKYGQVRWHAVSGVADTTDTDALPDAVPVTGTVTFRPSAKVLLVTEGSDPTTVFLMPVDAEVINGHLVDVQGRDPITLVSTDTVANPPKWQWVAEYRLNGGAARGSFPFDLPEGAVVDLTSVSPVAISGSTAIIQGPKGDPGPAGGGILWAPNTSYTAGQIVIDPAGRIVAANTTFTSGSTYNAANWTPTQSAPRALVPTTTKTAPYTAAASDLAILDVAAGATTLTLPTAPADGSQVGVRASGATASVPLTINRGGTDTIGTGGSTSATVELAAETVVLQYEAGTGRWYFISQYRTLSSLEGRFAVRPSGGAEGRPLVKSGSTMAWGPALLDDPGVAALISTAGTAVADALDASYLPASAASDFAGAHVEARKKVDETVTNSASMQDDDELGVPIDEDGITRITGMLYIDADSTADFKCQFSLPSGATMKWRILAPPTSSSTTPANTAWEALTETSVGKAPGFGVGVQVPVQIIGTVTSTGPGTVRLQWAQNSPAAGLTTKVCAGSWLRIEPVTSRVIPLVNDVAVFANEVFKVQSPQQSYSLALTPAPNTPTYARFELRSGDQFVGDIGTHTTGQGRQRVEMAGSTRWPLSTDIWLSLGIRVGVGTLPDSFTILSQMLQRPPAGETGRSPVFAMHLESGQLQLVTTGDSAASTTVKPPNVVRYAETFADAGTWMRWVFRLNFHWSTGRLQAWKNGVQVCDLTNLLMGFNDPRGPYYKFGMYRQGSVLTNVVEMANIEVGTTDLSSRITSPLTLPA